MTTTMLPPIETVANTIFPVGIAGSSRDHVDLVGRYVTMMPTLKRFKGNERGTYFGRLVHHPGKEGPFDQIGAVIERRADYACAFFDVRRAARFQGRRRLKQHALIAKVRRDVREHFHCGLGRAKNRDARGAKYRASFDHLVLAHPRGEQRLGRARAPRRRGVDAARNAAARTRSPG